MSENLKQSEPERTSGGYRVGERHHKAKYSDEQVARVRLLYEQGWTRREIADDTGVQIESVRKYSLGQRRAQASTAQTAEERVRTSARKRRAEVEARLGKLREMKARIDAIDAEIAEAEASLKWLDAVLQVSV